MRDSSVEEQAAYWRKKIDSWSDEELVDWLDSLLRPYEAHPDVIPDPGRLVIDAARAYRDLLANERVRDISQGESMLMQEAASRYVDLLANPAEPDWEAALAEYRLVGGAFRMGRVKAIVKAAVAGRLLVEKPKPKTCKHGHTTMHDGGEFACAGPIGERVEKP